MFCDVLWNVFYYVCFGFYIIDDVFFDDVLCVICVYYVVFGFDEM